MALFDNINSRYTQSMAEGGTYQRDASVGGYSRKELRGLSKQAKSGTLTQRERARYEHLRGERKGRRKRGLLAGLGGAAALAGGLAAAGKLGGGSGGGGLMDSIKNRLSERRGRKLQDKFGKENLASAIEGSEDKEVNINDIELDDLSDMPLEEEADIAGDKTGEQLKREALDSRTEIGRRMREEGEYNTQMDLGRHSSMQAPSNMELYDEYGGSFDGMEGELRARNKASQVVQGSHPMDMHYGYDPETGISDGRGRIGRDEDELAPGGSYENEADLKYMRGNNEFFKNTTDASFPMSADEEWRRKELAWDADDQEGSFRPFGYEVEGDIPAEGRPLTEADALRSRMARRPGQPYDRSGLPDPEYGGNMEEGKMETLPGADGEEPTQSGGATVRQLLSSLEGSDSAKGLKDRLTSSKSNVQQRMDAFMKRTGGFKPGANGMRVGTAKQEKIDRLRKFMKNRYR